MDRTPTYPNFFKDSKTVKLPKYNLAIVIIETVS